VGDFKFSNGKVKKGVLAAVSSAIVLLVIPSMMLLISRSITGEPATFYSNANSLLTIVVVAAIPAIALAFFRGHYPRGSISRLVFGEAETIAVLAYLILVVTSTYLTGMFGSLDYGLDTNRFLLTLIYIVPLMAVGFVGQFFVNRREWLKSTGVERPVKPLPSGIGLDFSLRVGDPGKALKGAKREALGLVLIPALILLIAIPAVFAFASSISPSVAALLNDLSSIVDIVLLLGVIALPLAYIRGFYPKGSFSRMLVFILHSLFLVYFIYSVLVCSHLGDGISGVGLHFDYNEAVLLLMLIPLFSIIVAVGEVVDDRKNWEEKLGFQVKRKPINTASAFLDFNPRTGKLGDAARACRRSYTFWLVLPLITLSIAAGVIRDTSDILNNLALASEIDNIATAIIPISVIIVILSFPWGFYPKGSFGRFLFGIVVTPILVLFVLSVFMNGQLQQALFNSGIKVDLSFVELMLVLYALSFIIVPACELADNRRAWKKIYGRSLKQLSPPKPGLMTDFRIRYARFLNGAKDGRRAIILFVVLPILVLVVARAALQSTDNTYVQQALADLHGLDTKLALVGFGLAAVMFLRGTWGPGAFSRLLFGLVVTVVDVLWTLVLIGGLSNVSAQINVPGGYSIDLSPYLGYVLIIFVVLAAFIGVKYAFEYARHREQWVKTRESLVIE
jgi:hypothetical protein